MNKKITLVLIFLFLTGCNRSSETPEPLNVPTIAALTAAALPSPTLAEPTSTPTATPTSLPTPTSTSTNTPYPFDQDDVPYPGIQVLSPGVMSKVISPISLRGYIQPGAEGYIQVELLGEDGRLLARDLFYRQAILAEGAYVNLEIPFETRAAAELGRLQISTKDEFNRPAQTYSVHLLLLSVGKNDINPSHTEYPRAFFYTPEAEDEVDGGILVIAGEVQSYNDSPVILELLDEEGEVLGLRTMDLEAGNREKFETTIEYKVSEQVSARLVIRQADEDFDGRIFLHSQVVILNP